MAYTRSLTLTSDSGSVRFTLCPDGTLTIEMPGEHGWEDSYEVNIDEGDMDALESFLSGVAE